jgi:predicted transcriptional regulator of viral defense system
MDVLPKAKPDWDRLYETASAQDGHFSTQQAALAGYSSQLLLKHIRARRVTRVRRGIYRLVHFPAGEHEELVVAWLWSEREGVFSHETALALHGLSDVLPARAHLTLPADWRRRRFRVPDGIVLHHDDVRRAERVWIGPVPVTSPRRTLVDCAKAFVAPDILRQAAQQAIRRGLVVRRDLAVIERALAAFGGLAA